MSVQYSCSASPSPMSHSLHCTAWSSTVHTIVHLIYYLFLRFCFRILQSHVYFVVNKVDICTNSNDLRLPRTYTINQAINSLPARRVRQIFSVSFLMAKKLIDQGDDSFDRPRLKKSILKKTPSKRIPQSDIGKTVSEKVWIS